MARNRTKPYLRLRKEKKLEKYVELSDGSKVRVVVHYESKPVPSPASNFEPPCYETERTIRKVIFHDGKASDALRELHASGVNPNLFFACLTDYVGKAAEPKPRHKPRAYVQAGVYYDGHTRRARITPEKLKSLPERLRSIADEVYLLGVFGILPRTLPYPVFQTHDSLMQLANCLGKNRPRLPDARSLRGKNEALRNVLRYTGPRPCGLRTMDLARLIARLIKPVAEHFKFECPTTESLYRIILRMRRPTG